MLYQSYLNKAIKNKERHKKLTEKLKRKKPVTLDKDFAELHFNVFEETDCLKCANCCKTTSPAFYEKDIERAAAALKIKPGQFILQFLKKDEDNDYVLQQSPCPFLSQDNYCNIYASRPTACREYPHTNRKRMTQILDLTFQNSMICPAVARIFEKLQTIYS